MNNSTDSEMTKNPVRVRIAPSPTGIPHIGNTRTALFNYLFAKKNKGIFILRIEDTDQNRIVKEAIPAIHEILEWLTLSVDEEYVQSERLALYKEHAQKLIDKGFAYNKDGAVWMKIPEGKAFSWDDLIGSKHIVFESKSVEDFVILKSDGFPTYHLASVVDDHLMNISHVFRGEEWISSTPKHLLLYESFSWKPPYFAHLPVILGQDKTKLSKRHGAKSVLDYKNEGYLKEAIINFMALLGWNPGGDKEILSISDMIQLFDIKDLNTASPIFDVKKLEWMNGMYIRKMSSKDLAQELYEFFGKRYSLEIIERTAPIIQDRIKRLSDYLPLCEFFFDDPKKFEIDLSLQKPLIKKIHDVLVALELWKAEQIGTVLQKMVADLSLKPSDFFMTLRVAITGKKISPPLNESMEILGKEKVLQILKKLSL